MADDFALDEAGLVRDEQVPAAIAKELPIALHGGHAALEPLLLRVGHREAPGELLLGERAVLLDHGKDGFALGDFGRILGQVFGFARQSLAHSRKIRRLVRSPDGGIGRRTSFRYWRVKTWGVQVPSRHPVLFPRAALYPFF